MKITKRIDPESEITALKKEVERLRVEARLLQRNMANWERLGRSEEARADAAEAEIAALKEKVDDAQELAAEWLGDAKKRDVEIELLQARIDDTHACPACPARTDLETVDAENVALKKKVERLEELKTWCPNCGEDVALDEDLCCQGCGNEATVDLARVQHEHHRAVAAEAKLGEVRKNERKATMALVILSGKVFCDGPREILAAINAAEAELVKNEATDRAEPEKGA